MPQVSVGTSGVLAAPQNRLRKSIVFLNTSTANAIFLDNLAPSAISTTNAGVKLGAGASIAFNSLIDGQATITDSWAAVSDSGTNTLIWKETEDVLR